MSNCECEDHYYEVIISASNKRILTSLTNSTVEDVIERIGDGNLIWSDVHGGEYSYENIVERCDHGDVQDCEDCDFKEEE